MLGKMVLVDVDDVDVVVTGSVVEEADDEARSVFVLVMVCVVVIVVGDDVEVLVTVNGTVVEVDDKLDNVDVDVITDDDDDDDDDDGDDDDTELVGGAVEALVDVTSGVDDVTVDE